MCKISLTAAAALVVASASITAHAATKGLVNVWFAMPAEDVSALLANVCADREAFVVEQDSNHVLCSRETTGFSGALTKALIGNRYSTTPEMKVRFSILRQQDLVRVQASQWLETQMAFGQVRRSALDGRKHTDSLRQTLTAYGAMTEDRAASWRQEQSILRAAAMPTRRGLTAPATPAPVAKTP